MSVQLRKLWQSRTLQERMMIAAVAAIIGAALVLWLLLAADRARTQLRTAVMTLRTQAVRLERQAAELDRLRVAPVAAASQSDLRTLVQAQAGDAGLTRALVRIDAPDANQAQVSFGGIAFADWLAWVARLQSQRIRLDACQLEALSTPGLVSATATFVREK